MVGSQLRRTQSPDIGPEAEQVLTELFRRVPAWRKLRMVDDTNRRVMGLLTSGLCQPFTKDTPERLCRRLATLGWGRN
jgi:hypothetical protein